MLDDAEFRQVVSLRSRDRREVDRERMFGAMLREYARLTGFYETNPNAIYRHHLSIYGPPCSKCGKPLRTPRAKLCGSCMRPVEKRA
jgi:hypothetical protein